jgi:hypothetical protein
MDDAVVSLIEKSLVLERAGEHGRRDSEHNIGIKSPAGQHRRLGSFLWAEVGISSVMWRTTTRVSVAGDGTPANGDSYQPRISGDGRFVTLSSWASNLVSSDSSGARDIFVRGQTSPIPTP